MSIRISVRLYREGRQDAKTETHLNDRALELPVLAQHRLCIDRRARLGLEAPWQVPLRVLEQQARAFLPINFEDVDHVQQGRADDVPSRAFRVRRYLRTLC